MPEDGDAHAAFSDPRPFDVLGAAAEPAQFLAWRKVGRRRLGIGLESPPRRYE